MASEIEVDNAVKTYLSNIANQRSDGKEIDLLLALAKFLHEMDNTVSKGKPLEIVGSTVLAEMLIIVNTLQSKIALKPIQVPKKFDTAVAPPHVLEFTTLLRESLRLSSATERELVWTIVRDEAMSTPLSTVVIRALESSAADEKTVDSSPSGDESDPSIQKSYVASYFIRNSEEFKYPLRQSNLDLEKISPIEIWHAIIRAPQLYDNLLKVIISRVFGKKYIGEGKWAISWRDGKNKEDRLLKLAECIGPDWNLLQKYITYDSIYDLGPVIT